MNIYAYQRPLGPIADDEAAVRNERKAQIQLLTSID